MSLKVMCYRLLRKQNTLLALSLYGHPDTLIDTLTRLLNEWKHDEVQGTIKSSITETSSLMRLGEQIPMYEEFSACLLFTVLLVHCTGYKSRTTDLDRTNAFFQCFVNGNLATRNDSYAKENEKIIGDWIRGLFETQGVNDTLLSTCSPQTFFCVVPMIIEQAVVASRMKVLDEQSQRNGLER